MDDAIKKIIEKLEVLKSEVEEKSVIAEKVINACHTVGKSWCGSSLAGHGKFYFGNFEEPDVYNRFSIEWGLIHGVPEGWEEKDRETVREKIEQISSVDLEVLRAFATKLEKDFTDLKRDTILSLNDIGISEPNSIENFSFKSATDHFNAIFPTKYMTRDSEAMTGHYVAGHIYYESIALFIKSFPEDLKTFVFEIKKTVKTNTKQALLQSQTKSNYYVENITILRLSEINSPDFDLSKLIKLCQELNDNYSLENYLACGMIIRSILDHVPPIFGKKNFEEVCSNYGTKSFKDIVKPLQDSSKKIADSYLHTQIRGKETLPTKTQISYQPNLDYLLNEIVTVISSYGDERRNI
ncbi:MAG: hypothetical protein KBD24_00940 [Candidatus Pacebacteria bacterium]|nr:hypothetical protein [Candidatus Paceibacterota bacterium]